MRVIAYLIIFLPLSVFSQVATKDTRSIEQKDDPYSIYNASNINKITLLKALEIAGINIFNISLKKFDKKYHLEITLDEYIDTRKVSSKNISVSTNNEYSYYRKNKRQISYIDHIDIFSRDIDSLSILKIETYAGSLNGIKLKQNKNRKNQFYNWRTFGKTNWVLNENIPILVYASSWYDKENDIERFCGAVDLSKNEDDTKMLLGNSPHYYLISYKVSNE